MSYGSTKYHEYSVLSLSLSVCLLPSLPGPPSGSEALTVDSESFLDGPSLSQITPRLYQRAQRLTQVAQRSSQVAQRPSQLAQSPSQLDLRPSQLALRPSQLAPSPSQLASNPSQPEPSSSQRALKPFLSFEMVIVAYC